MALALLELTETASGDVLEKLLVTTNAEAAADKRVATAGELKRVRLFAQIGSELTGVPRSVRLQLDHVALASVRQLSKRRRGIRIPSTSFTALWHHGQLQELHSHSLAESLDVWQRQAGTDDDYVLIEISGSSRRDADYRGESLERLYARLRGDLAERIVRPLDSSVRKGPPRTTDRPNAPLQPETVTPEQQLLQDAAAQRQSLASKWFTAADLSEPLGSHATNVSHRASQLRREGKLLGVYVSHPSPSYRYPNWQFQRPGEPVHLLAEILRVLREFGPFEREPNGLRRTTGWGEVEWFLSPHVLLDGAAPADMLQIAPERVLQAAKTEFEEDA